jgi:uncharacterized protein (TIGR02246 family)
MDSVIADLGIRQLYGRYVDAVWRKDAEAFGDCFTQDGVWKLAGMQMDGRASITATIGQFLGICERVLIIPGSPVLEFGDGTATGRVHATELSKMVDGTSAMTIGVYYDQFVEEEGVWRFSRRHWALHYRGPVDMSAAFVPSPDYGPPPHQPAADEPTLTMRPAA